MGEKVSKKMVILLSDLVEKKKQVIGRFTPGTSPQCAPGNGDHPGQVKLGPWKWKIQTMADFPGH